MIIMADKYVITDIEEVTTSEDGFSGSSVDEILCSFTQSGKGKIEEEEVEILAHIAYTHDHTIYYRQVAISSPVEYVGAKGVGEEVENWLDKLESEIRIENIDQQEDMDNE